jgi:hypothetical protein
MPSATTQCPFKTRRAACTIRPTYCIRIGLDYVGSRLAAAGICHWSGGETITIKRKSVVPMPVDHVLDSDGLKIASSLRHGAPP